MFNQVFYHQTIRRAVAVFGTVFNNINIVRRDSSGKMLNTIKVPLAYGPKQKFLSRIDQQASLDDTKIAIKLPRLSFELTSLEYASDRKLQKGHTVSVRNTNAKMLGPVDYNLGFQLNIMAKNQDDALQILEQILPYFQPDYDVTVKQVGDSERNDMAIILQSVSLSDDYEGDFNTRRVLLYTLDFQTKIRFYGPVVPTAEIKRVVANLNEGSKLLSGVSLTVNPLSASSEEAHTVDIRYFSETPDRIILTLATTTGLTEKSIIVGATSASSGIISSINGNQVTVINVDGKFLIEQLTTGQSILSFEEVYDE